MEDEAGVEEDVGEAEDVSVVEEEGVTVVLVPTATAVVEEGDTLPDGRGIPWPY